MHSAIKDLVLVFTTNLKYSLGGVMVSMLTQVLGGVMVSMLTLGSWWCNG